MRSFVSFKSEDCRYFQIWSGKIDKRMGFSFPRRVLVTLYSIENVIVQLFPWFGGGLLGVPVSRRITREHLFLLLLVSTASTWNTFATVQRIRGHEGVRIDWSNSVFNGHFTGKSGRNAYQCHPRRLLLLGLVCFHRKRGNHPRHSASANTPRRHTGIRRTIA